MNRRAPDRISRYDCPRGGTAKAELSPWSARCVRSAAGIAWVSAIGGWLHAAEPGPPWYGWSHPTTDAAGGVVGSAHYRLVSSLGGSGGANQSAGTLYTNRRGSVGSQNDPPSPRADTVRSGADWTAKVRVTNLLANDEDPEDDSLELHGFELFTLAGGRVTRDGVWLLYEPPSPFPGSDSFRYTVRDAAGNAASALVTVLVAESQATPSQNLITITLLPNGHRYIAFAGIAGRRYTIEWSDQLPAVRWEVLATVQADGRGLIEWVDGTEPLPSNDSIER